MAVGSFIKNTLVYVIVMGVVIFFSVQLFLFTGLVGLIQYAGNTSLLETGTQAIFDIFAGLLLIFVGLGVAINLSLPSIVSDQLIEF
ncbi:MAG: hypothetical protein ACXAE3_00280 [Candidatus Kariarchaeaceae archaeon]|jgi:hypothetical protein